MRSPRIVRLIGLALMLLPAAHAAAAPAEPGLTTGGMMDLQYALSDSEQTWLRRGPDKLRFDESDQSSLQLGRAGLVLDYAFDVQSELKVAAHYYPDPDSSIELAEAFWQHRSFGDGRWRSRYRVGMFYPAISMENTGPLWTSPYTVNSSAINTWIGEELRVIGAEGRWTWAGDAYNRSKHRLSLFASVFGFNDTLGAMISWRGWSVHDRQTGLNGTLPIRELPTVVYSNHSREFEPFKEIDDRPGWYAGTEWQYDRDLKLQLTYYDNRADDTIRQADQYGWRTKFGQIAFHWRMNDDYQLLGQWMRGRTIMVKDVVINDFESGYLMAVRTWGRHRLALRTEYFRVIDQDHSAFDLNREDGDSQTLSYSLLFREGWKVSLEAIRFFSDYAARRHFGERERRAEHELLLSLRYYF
ncbi:MAG: hypothetical protein R3E86_14610 [Pseudomonadales bacterium]